jgi:hypothetical protein
LRVDQADGIQVDDVPTYGYEFHGVFLVSPMLSTRFVAVTLWVFRGQGKLRCWTHGLPQSK